MSTNFVISCCTTADMSVEKMKQLDVRYISTPYMLDGKEYLDDLGQTISYADFYKSMEEGKMTATAQINQTEFEEYFRKILEEGKDLLHFTLSSGLSGTYNNVRLAMEVLREEFPDRKIMYVDTLAASSGFGLLVSEACALRDKGMSIDEVYAEIEAKKLNLHHWFFTTDLTYFVRGGRVSKASGFIGGVLGICPLLDVNDAGKLTPRFKIRGKKKVIAEIVEQMKNHAENGTNYSGKVYISNSACIEDAKAVAALVKESFPNLDGEVEIFDIGTTIGSHTGPGTVALFYWGDRRVE